jgi:hypothetical protein
MEPGRIIYTSNYQEHVIELLLARIKELEYELCKADWAEEDSAVWKHLYFLEKAEQKYRKEHPVRSLFGMTPCDEHMHASARQLYESEETL